MYERELGERYPTRKVYWNGEGPEGKVPDVILYEGEQMPEYAARVLPEPYKICPRGHLHRKCLQRRAVPAP
jgi:hypothetical protein